MREIKCVGIAIGHGKRAQVWIPHLHKLAIGAKDIHQLESLHVSLTRANVQNGLEYGPLFMIQATVLLLEQAGT